MPPSPKDLSQRIKLLAYGQGFSACGIAKAEFLEGSALQVQRYLDKGYQGQMSYLERNIDKRLDPRLLLDGAKSVISVMMNYYPSQVQDPQLPQIAKYAYGQDYHKLLKDKLYVICSELKDEMGDFSHRVFVDSAPVLEREWARRAGLGWIGKNTHLINPRMGSYFFLGEIITDLEFDYDTPDSQQDRCGACRRCQMACPTGAINGDKTMDASRCVSYLTIELKSEISQEDRSKLSNKLYGCDICIDVCPWNRFKSPSKELALSANIDLLDMSREKWGDISQEEFDVKFSQSAIKRAGLDKIRSTLYFCD